MTSRNSLAERQMGSFTKKNSHELCYENSEFLFNVTSSIKYVMSNFNVNPGMLTTFPVLSGVAVNYEQYYFEELEFFYRPLENEQIYSTSQNYGLGIVGMVFVFDAALSGNSAVPGGAIPDNVPVPFANRSEFFNYEGAVVQVPTKERLFKVNLRNRPQKLLFIRQGETYNIDLRESDLGTFCVCVAGQQSNDYLMGEMYVRYKVRLLKSTPKYSLGLANLSCCYGLLNVDLNNIFGTEQFPLNNFSKLSLSFFTFNGYNYFSFPSGMVWGLEFKFILIITGNTETWAISSPQFIGCEGYMWSGLTAAGPEPTMTIVGTVQLINSVSNTSMDNRVNVAAVGFSQGNPIPTGSVTARLFVYQEALHFDGD